MDGYSYEFTAPQGWQCPICKRVYSPTTSMCYYCGNEKTVVGTTTTDGTSTSNYIEETIKSIEEKYKDIINKLKEENNKNEG